MDIASIVGFIALVTTLMVGMGSNLSIMIDPPSLIIVIGGALAGLLISFPLQDLLGPTIRCKLYILSPPREATPEVMRNLEIGIEVFRKAGIYANAMGWIGVLIGLVIMFGHGAMQDLDHLGPGMAICLLTALYGTIYHFMLCLPMRTKLERIQKDLQSGS